MANYCSERKGRQVPKIRFYHIRTLLLTYLVWAVLNLLLALLFCQPTGQQIYLHSIRKAHYSSAPYYWAMLHIAPLLALIATLWEGDLDWFVFFIVPVVVAGFAIVAGLLIKGHWARFLIIMGMSVWFFLAMCIVAMGA